MVFLRMGWEGMTTEGPRTVLGVTERFYIFTAVQGFHGSTQLLTHRTTHWKWVSIILSNLHLNRGGIFKSVSG